MIQELRRPAPESAAAARTGAMEEQLQHLGEQANWADATAMLLVDAILDGQVQPLEAFLDHAARHQLRDAHEAALEALASVAHWGIARILPVASARELDWHAAEGRILSYLDDCAEATNTDIFMHLQLAEATVSRIGNRLEQDGLVIRDRAGKWLRWRLSQEGAHVLETARQAGLVPRKGRVSSPARKASRSAVAQDAASLGETVDELLDINRRAARRSSNR